MTETEMTFVSCFLFQVSVVFWVILLRHKLSVGGSIYSFLDWKGNDDKPKGLAIDHKWQQLQKFIEFANNLSGCIGSRCVTSSRQLDIGQASSNFRHEVFSDK